MYTFSMESLPVTDARDNFAETLQHVAKGPVEITRHGKAVAVMMDPMTFDALVAAAEEIADIEAVDQAELESSPLIPWEQVKQDLGLQ